ncbi:acyltransferase [Terasakiispira papahanaumokuakeensis]|uniref:acyltransferase n=1 Tax=Terasakiispira papahanaumokuakeensis TaxID=197479 RepID=UPI000B1CE6B6|nr:acyltransferase [Terasakiispira papahanaumokuakeensis]
MKALRHFVTGMLVILLLLLNTLVGIVPMMIMALLKLLPAPPMQRVLGNGIMWVARAWATVDQWIFAALTPTRWDIQGRAQLSRDESLLVIANHQSWVDIPALIEALNNQVPDFKFFLKRELVWVPFLGLAFWALDFPFMRRYSKSVLRKHPELARKDLETTRRACEKFRHYPVSVINFIEGTRFTPAKHERQQSPFQCLLRPKSGGVAYALDAMQGQIRHLLDVTVFYPDGVPNFWQLLSGQVRRVVVILDKQPIPEHLINGDYQGDPAYRSGFQQWLNERWRAKDERLVQWREQGRKTGSDHSIS